MSDDSEDSYESDESSTVYASKRAVRRTRTRVNYAGFGDSRRNGDDDDDDSDRPRRRGQKSKESSDEEDGESRSQTPQEPLMEIESLVARRNGDTGDSNATVGPFDYLVKWKELSYLHVEWIAEPDLLYLGGPSMKTKIKRFNLAWEKGKFKQLNAVPAAEKDEDAEDDVTSKMEHWSAVGQLFDPSLTEIEKIVAMKVVDEALAKPYSLPEEPEPEPEVTPSSSPEPGTEGPTNGSSSDSTVAASSVSAKAPRLQDDDIVPNANVTLGELKRLHDEYDYPPFRQAIHIREMKKLAADLEMRIATMKQARDREVMELEAQYHAAASSANADPSGMNQRVTELQEAIALTKASHEEELAKLDQELVRIKRAGADKLYLAPRECYLVKWKGASYKNLTWEWPEAVNDDLKIALFKRLETPPSGVQPIMNRQQQHAAMMKQRRLQQEHSVSTSAAPVPNRNTELDLARFRRAAETLPVLRVPQALVPYALQLEVSGLAQKEDEIICVNGVRCTGMRTEEIHKLIKENTNEVRVLRFLRRDTGHELEIKFDPQKRMGFVMDELKQDTQHQQQLSIAQRMSHSRRRTTVEYSARIKKFPTPDDFTRGNKPAPPDYVNSAVRSAVLAVFSAREPLSPLTLEKWSLECGVPTEYLHKWLLKDVPNDEQLRVNEQKFQLWLARCAMAFSCSPSVDIATIEKSLLLGNPHNVSLPEGRDNDVLEPNRAYAKSLLGTAQNELLGTESRFESEARRQLMDFQVATMTGQITLQSSDAAQSLQADEEMDEPDEMIYQEESEGGASIHIQQLRRIQLVQSGAVRFIPYGPNNLPRFKNSNTLREYQLQGVNWLVSKWYEGKNCILADEMGLGKTVQVVAFLEHLRVREQLRGPFLIVAPLSTMGHWRREFENWTDANVCFYYDTQGGAKGRELIRQYEWFYEKLGYRHDVCKFNVLLTTYETFIADVEEMSKIPFISLVVDEGHRLKNQGGKLLNELRKIRVKHRLLLSGTPLQNNLHELWSLLNFCEPEKFHNADAFLRRHENLQTVEDVMRLQQEIAPYMLRRVKEDVEKSIPPKEETIVDVELTTLQKKYYRAIFERNREFLYKGCKGNNKPQLINVEIELRKCCNHPFLIVGAREKEMEELQQQFEFEHASLPPKEKTKKWNQYYIQRFVQNSGKLVLVEKLLAKLKAEGRKVLIFSQMVKMLDLLKEFLEFKGYQYERLDGSVQGNTRQAAIDRFSRPDSQSFVFLLSTRAGGVGINLTAADTVIIFDSDWNPQNDAQAQARCHRIGQDKPVTIYRLVTKNSYEETMLDRAARKLGLEQAVLGAGTTGQSGRELKPEELERMLRLGAYHHLQPSAKDEEDTANFMNQDIDSLLRTRTRKIKVDGIRGTVSLELTHNTTSEAAAEATKPKEGTVTAANGEDVDVNDPDFWTKMLPKEETAQSLLFKLSEHDSISELKQNAEAKFKFVKRVREIVEEILQLRDRGEVIDYNRMDTTIMLLVQMSNMLGVFGRETCEAAKKWNNAIEAAKERKSRQKARELQGGFSQYDERRLYGDPDMDLVEEEEEVHAKPHKSPAPSTDVNVDMDGKGQPWGFQSCHGCYDPTGSDLYPCTGKCNRAFHPACYKVGLSSFTKCDECMVGGKCAVCDVTAREAESGKPWESSMVRKCARPDCGRFFHRGCLKNIDPKLVTLNVKGSEDEFYCPAHKCSKCGRGEGPAAGPVCVQCIRCTKAFHLCCMDAQRTKRASKNLIVCPDHFKGRTFPVSEHLKYGELTKRKPVGRPPEGTKTTKRVKDEDGAERPKKKAATGGAGASTAAKSGPKGAGGGASGPKTKKVAPIVLKLKPSTTTTSPTT